MTHRPGPRTLRVELHDEAAGELLLLLHGFTGGAGSWGSETLSRLAELRPIALLELPGHGGSPPERDPERWRVGPLVESVVATQRTLVGEGECDWLGYSMGGRLALSAACRGAPIRRLMLESTSPGIRGSEARTARVEADRLWVERLRTEGIESFVEHWMSRPIFAERASLPAPVHAPRRALALRADPESLAACLEGFGAGVQPSNRGCLPDLDLPVSMLVGGKDRRYVEYAREMEREIAGATLTVVPGVGHTIHLEAPEAWLAWAGSER